MLSWKIRFFPLKLKWTVCGIKIMKLSLLLVRIKSKISLCKDSCSFDHMDSVASFSHHFFRNIYADLITTHKKCTLNCFLLSTSGLCLYRCLKLIVTFWTKITKILILDIQEDTQMQNKIVSTPILNSVV